MHVTYCLNIHAGESWAEQFAAIQTYTLAVRDRVAPGRPFGLGLRLSARSAEELARPDALAAFRAFLARESLYVVTVNGFPFGAFHGTRVKEQVYRPDWREDARVIFTRQIAHILAALAPPASCRSISTMPMPSKDGNKSASEARPDSYGSISTVPVGFGPDFTAPECRQRAAATLVALARDFAELEARTGVRIALALEPEPGCVLETCDDVLSFFGLLHDVAGSDALRIARHIGVCLDTCHVALAFEDILETWDALEWAGIFVAKIQVSAALEIHGAPPPALSRFVEPVYLHQVRLRSRDGRRHAWMDLPEALAEWPADAECARVHFHVPLHWSGGNGLRSTRDTLTARFWERLRGGACPHIEVETYTFDVLPDELRAGGAIDSIARELEWVHERLRPA